MVNDAVQGYLNILKKTESEAKIQINHYWESVS